MRKFFIPLFRYSMFRVGVFPIYDSECNFLLCFGRINCLCIILSWGVNKVIQITAIIDFAYLKHLDVYISYHHILGKRTDEASSDFDSRSLENVESQCLYGKDHMQPQPSKRQRISKKAIASKRIVNS